MSKNVLKQRNVEVEERPLARENGNGTTEKKKEYEVENLVNKRIHKGKVSLLLALGSWGRSPAFFARRQLLRAWNRLGWDRIPSKMEGIFFWWEHLGAGGRSWLPGISSRMRQEWGTCQTIGWGVKREKGEEKNVRQVSLTRNA